MALGMTAGTAYVASGEMMGAFYARMLADEAEEVRRLAVTFVPLTDASQVIVQHLMETDSSVVVQATAAYRLGEQGDEQVQLLHAQQAEEHAITSPFTSRPRVGRRPPHVGVT